MAAIKKMRRTGRKLHGRKRASKWQAPRRSKAAREALSKEDWEKQEKKRARTRKQRGETDSGYLALSRALIDGAGRGSKVEPATDCRRQQELESSRLSKNLDALIEMKGTKGLAKVIGGIITKHGKKRKHEPKKLRRRPVNPKLYKMGDGVTQSLIHGFLACRVQLQYVLRGWRRAVSKAAMTYGSIFHDLLEWYYRGIMEGEVTRDTNFRAFAKKHTRRWIKKNSKELRHAGDLKMAFEEAAKVCVVFPAYCHYHEEDFDEIEWQELEGVFDIKWKGFRLKGRWDGLYKIGNELWLLETKTKSRIEKKLIREMLAFDFQSLFYITALAQRLSKKISGVRYNVIRNPGLKQGKKESTKKFLKRIAKDAEKRQAFYFMRFESPFDKGDRLAFEEELLAILNEMKDWLDGKLATFKNGGSCIKRYNCDFMSACSSGTMVGYLGKGKLFTELL